VIAAIVVIEAVLEKKPVRWFNGRWGMALVELTARSTRRLSISTASFNLDFSTTGLRFTIGLCDCNDEDLAVDIMLYEMLAVVSTSLLAG